MEGSSTEDIRGEDIAIIGMAGRFPGARNTEKFWQNLRDGVESISFFSDEELSSAGLDSATFSHPNYVRAAGVLDDIELFAAPFFGINPREAEVIDPQHRLFLECAWEALEDAGYDSETYEGRIGVYAGAGMNTYLLYNLYSNREVIRAVGDFQTMIGNDKDFLPTRVSYKLNLRGPSVSVQTACSTSLVAVCHACQSLQTFQSDIVLAGGVSVRVPRNAGYLYQEGGIMSPDGHCRAFDAKAKGTVVGSGVAIVVLKRLVDAIADGDTIHAVIRGSAINNDGSAKVGYTAPSIEGQTEVIAEARAMAEVEADTISYVEAHGTGTTLGDPIEIAALTQVFRAHTDSRNFCAIGSVKTNVGHLDTAAGVAGLIKTVLALKHKQLPPSLHFEQPNPNIDFANSPFFVNHQLTEWKRGRTPRRAGVSSFGIGGTNAHVIVEEAPEVETTDSGKPWQLLLLSARTDTALDAMTTNLARHLKENPETNLADAAYTYAVGRKTFEHRRMVVCRDTEDAARVLETLDGKRVLTNFHGPAERPVAFLFAGGGTQYVEMGRELYDREPVFREQVDICSELLQPYLGIDLRRILYPPPAEREAAARKLNEMSIFQPALFVIEYALARLWMSWGIEPHAMLGHSTGEYAAACLAGVFTLEDTLSILAARGRLMQQMPDGAMLAVPLSEQEVQPLLNDDLSLSAVNSPAMCVLAGSPEAVASLEENLQSRGLDCRRLQTAQAAHSKMMDPILGTFIEKVERLVLRPPNKPFISNVTGTWITNAQATDPHYWSQHLRQTVRFADGVGTLLKEPELILLELGPGKTLGSLAKQHPAKTAGHVVVSSLRNLSVYSGGQQNPPAQAGGSDRAQDSDVASMLHALGQLWLAGKRFDARGFYADQKRRRVSLPTYPFERQRYWVEARRLEEVGGTESSHEVPHYADQPQPATPRPVHSRPSLSSDYFAPRNEVERTLADIWQKLLGIEQVGIHDNFFELDGHSLLATQVISRVRESFQVELPLRTIFELPTVAGLAERVDEAKLLAQDSLALPMRRVARERELPLSFAQQRLWFLDQLVPGNPFYNVPSAVRLIGQLDTAVLEQCLNEIVIRHEVLRTTYESIAGLPLQVISPNGSLTLAQVNLEGLPGDARECEALRLMSEEARRPFNLSEGPVMRALLLRLSSQEYVLLLTIHHIASDAWSMGVVVREVVALYEKLSAQESPQLPELPVQYVDFAQWQREWFRGEALETQLNYWKLQLGGDLPLLELPTDRPRPAMQTFRGASKFATLPVELLEDLKLLSQQESVTLFMTLLAAFKILLHRYTGETDIIVGSVIAGRNRVEIEELIGFFVNTIVLRTDLSGNPTVGQLLSRVREVALGAYAHQDLPFEGLVEELQPKRDMSHSPIFQVAFVLQNAPLPALEIPGLKINLLDLESESAKYDLTVQLFEQENGLKGYFEYNTDLFDASTIERFIKHYQNLLEAVVRNSEMRVADLPLLRGEERRQLLEEWNDTRAAFPEDVCIHQLFEDQVARTPDGVALSFVEADGSVEPQLTYTELNERANQLGNYLRRLGVGPEQVVGICLERSLEMVVSVLGVLKAGAAYLPLDPGYPAARLAGMVHDANATVVLTVLHLSEQTGTHAAQVVCLDDDARTIAQEAKQNSPALATADNLAYVIYTSGSSSQPKGVAVEHRGLCNLATVQMRAFGLNEQSRVLQFSSLSFDASAWEIFMALTSGAKLCMTSRENLISLPALAGLLREQAITTVTLTPAVLALLAHDNTPETLPALHTVIAAGESCPADVAARWLTGRRFFNAYGPTETTVCASFGEYVTAVPQGPSIGRPLENMELYMLDANFEPVPVGVSGELYIGGIGLARGYRNRPELTAQNFIPHPFSDQPGARLYKSGDVARYLPDGNVQFLGRLDGQVKLHGFRIEPGEIEAALGSHPAVGESVVVAREDVSGDKRLIAYVVPVPQDEAQPAVQTEELAELAAEHAAQWQTLYEDIYVQAAARDGATFNITGWNSSYTDQPLPVAEMEEWVDRTVERILALSPSRVLEIGCGTGLLLFRIAPYSTQYCATDFSTAALSYVRQQLSTLDQALPQVTLLERAADDFVDVEPHAFDVVVLNSVVQYFPSVDYLFDVLRNATRAVRPGGAIFIGDVRSFPLLNAFHASVQLHRAASTLPRTQLRQRVRDQVVQEEELTIAPAFFWNLRTRLPEISHVQVQLKRGRQQNELTRFRYDVVMHVGSEADGATEIEWLNWQEDAITLSSLRQLLAEATPEVLGIRGVPNARVAEAVRAAELLEGVAGVETAEGVREQLNATRAESDVDPEEFWELADELRYRAEISWSSVDTDSGRFDVVFARNNARVSFTPDTATDEITYANNPLQAKLKRAFDGQLIPRLRLFLQERLPEYMVPAAFVMLEALPLTPNGKLDRRALPAPGQSQLDLEKFVSPRSPDEEVMAGIFAEVLHQPRVSVHDDFFELGGHSLLATQVISRVRRTFAVELPVRCLFESPTVAGLSERVLAERGTLVTGSLAIPVVPRAGALPLSFAQQRLWFLDQFDPNSAAYNIPAAVRLNGALNVDALEESFNEVVRRHESLRTSFAMEAGAARQAIAPALKLKPTTVDLRSLAEDERETAVNHMALEEARRPFDLSTGPLLRASLLQLSEQEHVLLLTMHHIISDGWSMAVLIREVATLYEAFAQKRESPLPELMIQYADFAHWQREWLSGAVLDQQLSYWKRQLADIPALLELPVDHPRPALQSYKGATHYFALPKDLSEALKTRSQSEGVTVFMLLLAVFQTLLYRYTGQEDVVVGTPIANRNRAETESLIGFFVNTLVLRTDLSGDPTFSELLRRVREMALAAYTHQDLPFERLVGELQPERRMSHAPLFQVLFVLQNAPMPSLELPGLLLTPIIADTGIAKFDLTLSLEETVQGLKGYFEYNTDLFEPTTIARLSRHFQTLLEGAVANPAGRISELPLLTAAELNQLHAEWNDTAADYSMDVCVHKQFEEQVQRTPNAVALVFEQQRLTYDELNRRANQLAHYLRTMGVGAEALVAMCVERSLEMVVGILGILKAGGAYVPLDPAYPKERLAFMLKDTQAQWLLTQQSLVDLLPEDSAHRVLLDTDWPAIAKESEENLSHAATPDTLAYVIYTSGSTGQPKGTLVTHHNVARLFQATQPQFQFDEEDVWTLFHSYAFDFSVWELWGALLYGGRLVIVPYWVARSPDAFHRLLAEEQVTVLNQTPSAFRQLMRVDEAGLCPKSRKSDLDTLSTGSGSDLVSDQHAIFPKILDSIPLTRSLPLPVLTVSKNDLRLLRQSYEAAPTPDLTLRLVIFGGEALELQSLKPWLARHGDQRPQLVNMFGITETTVHVTYRALSQADLELGASSVIGRPLSCLQVYLLDQHGQLVPVGVPGEICVGGTGVSRGYLNRAELTAERFIPHPFSDEAGARLYRSGDLGRYLEDGDIEYLGRLDDQVKLRGFRIELGEIEAALLDHPAVRDCVVVLRDDMKADPRIVAYVVAHDETVSSASELRTLLKARLPEYMVPSDFVWLDALPLTPNGKIDRRALPAPGQSQLDLERFVSPRSPDEEVMAGIFAEVLHQPRVGVHDDFFELGGHSLLATQVISRVRRTFAVELPVRCLFESPTVAGLCERVLAERGTLMTGSLAIPLVPRTGMLPLSFAQQRLWFLDQFDPHSAAYNIPAAVRLNGALNVVALEESFNEVVRRHESLRTSFAMEAGAARQEIAPALKLKPTSVDLRSLAEDERETAVSHMALEEARRPFDLSTGPLLRASLLQLSEQEHVLLLTMHHIISDGWSMAVLIREVATLYEAFAQKRESPLPELMIQYADFAHWQREWLSGEVLDQQLSYWKRQLADIPALLELPVDHPRPALQSYKGATHYFALPKDLSDAIKTRSQSEGVTVFMLLLAVFQTLLYRYTGQEDVVVGSPIANRNRAETESLIGFFVNTLVLRTDLSGDPTFSELLSRVREMALAAYVHQDLPFERLVGELQPERRMSHAPLFQVLFVLQNAPMPSLELPGLLLTPIIADTGIAKFDLTLSLEETAQGLKGYFGYNTDLFEPTTIARLSRHFQTLLEGAVANSAGRISELPLLTGEELNQLHAEWSDTAADYPTDVCIHTLFERQVEQTPDAVALVFEEEELTYSELNERANQVARYLRRAGIGPDVLVGLCVERSLQMVVGLLGILKAGGGYVPLDPSYPKERLAFMLEDARTPILLTQEHLLESLPVHGAEVVCLDADWPSIELESAENLVTQIDASNLAYVIYTSGSTGKAKGVLIEQRRLVNYVFGVLDRLELRPAASYAWVQPLTVDSCVTAIYPPLINGGTLHLVSRERSASAQEMSRYFTRHKIDCLKIAPSHLAALQAAAEHPEQLLPRSCLVLGGEVSHWTYVRELQSMSSCKLFNHYGPTETTVGVSAYRIDGRESQANSATVPIGHPLANTQMYILDGRMQPVPIGIPGELFIGGECLARGYLNRPELTAEKFIPDPFSKTAGARLYRTGDLARYLIDGSIEFLGRLDHQVKIRGFRIELGEIEAALTEHPLVREALVVTDGGGSNGNGSRLVAYAVAESGAGPSPGELRSYLKEKLPEHMRPSAFMLLDALPLTPHGKIDRRALPAPVLERSAAEETFVAPRTPVEELLAKIWSEVLGIAYVGVDDNFFELGGDSILSIQIIARANQAGLRLTPKQLFQYQTIAGLAAVVRTGSSAAEQSPVTGDVPLTPIQHLFFEHNIQEPHHYNQAVLLEVRERLDASLLEKAIEQLLVHHDALNLRFTLHEKDWRQFNSTPQGATPFRHFDLSALPAAEQSTAIEKVAEQMQSSLSLSDGPLMRVALFDLGERKLGRLLTVIHHLAVDGVSWRILLEDLLTIYRQLSEDEAVSLPAKTTSFKQWAKGLVQYAQSTAVQSELPYWLTQVESVRSLPVDFPGGMNTRSSAGTVLVGLDEDETHALLHEVPEVYHTQSNDLLLTALARALSKWSGSSSQSLALEGHGREEISEDVDVSRTVGWFTTIFPVVLDLRGAWGPGDALQAIKEQLRRIPQRGLGYGLLRYLCEVPSLSNQLEKLRMLPLPEVSFNYLGQFDQVLPASAPFALTHENTGPLSSLKEERRHLLELTGSIIGNRLQMTWTYSQNVHRRTTVEKLAQSFIDELRTLITHCQSPEAGGFTPSDFPLAKLGQEQLNNVFAKLDEEEFEAVDE